MVGGDGEGGLCLNPSSCLTHLYILPCLIGCLIGSTCSDNSRCLIEFRLIHVKENALMSLRLRLPVFNLDGWLTDGASGGCDQTRVRGQDELKEDKEPWTGRLEENETAERGGEGDGGVMGRL